MAQVRNSASRKRLRGKMVGTVVVAAPCIVTSGVIDLSSFLRVFLPFSSWHSADVFVVLKWLP